MNEKTTSKDSRPTPVAAEGDRHSLDAAEVVALLGNLGDLQGSLAVPLGLRNPPAAAVVVPLHIQVVVVEVVPLHSQAAAAGAEPHHSQDWDLQDSPVAVVPHHIPALEELLVDGGEERQGNPVEVLQPQGRAEGVLLAWEHPFRDRLHQDSQTSVVSLSYRL